MKLRGLGPLPPPAPVPEEIRAKRRRKVGYLSQRQMGHSTSSNYNTLLSLKFLFFQGLL